MSTQNALFIPLWSKILSSLIDSPWEDEDVQNAAEENRLDAARSLQYTYIRLGRDQEGVRAALRAAREVYGNFFSADQLQAVVDGFQIRYVSWEVACQNYLDDRFGLDELQVSWFKDDAAIWAGVTRDSEVWVNPEGSPDGPQYVFTRPSPVA